MPIVSLVRVNLIAAIGDLGDRYNVGVQSCAIANSEWHLEAEYANGSIGDVALYRNMHVNIAGEKPKWKWYGAIPTANIKSYSLTAPPSPRALPNEPQAQNQAAKPADSAAKR